MRKKFPLCPIASEIFKKQIRGLNTAQNTEYVLIFGVSTFILSIVYFVNLFRRVVGDPVGDLPGFPKVEMISKIITRVVISVSQGGEEVVFQGGSQVLLQGGNQMAPSGARRSVQINLDQVCLFWSLAFIFLPHKGGGDVHRGGDQGDVRGPVRLPRGADQKGRWPRGELRGS